MNTTGNLLLLLSPHTEEFFQVLELDRLEFPRPWDQQDWQNLNWHHHQLYGWGQERQLKGFALFSHIPGDDQVHLLKICLSLDLRGGPDAGEFWCCILQKLTEQGIHSVYLEVEATNLRAVGFYLKQGFKTLRRIKGYYSDGVDACTMQLTL